MGVFCCDVKVSCIGYALRWSFHRLAMCWAGSGVIGGILRGSDCASVILEAAKSIGALTGLLSAPLRGGLFSATPRTLYGSLSRRADLLHTRTLSEQNRGISACRYL